MSKTKGKEKDRWGDPVERCPNGHVITPLGGCASPGCPHQVKPSR